MKGVIFFLITVALANGFSIRESNSVCDNLATSTLVAHENCNQFYQCDDGQAYSFTCGNNLLYNIDKAICDWPENVECGDRIIPGEEKPEPESTVNDDPSKAPEICAAEGSDGILVANEKCNKYYICNALVPLTMPCPTGLLYNPHNEQCDWPKNVNCDDRVTESDQDNDDNIESDCNSNDEAANENEDNTNDAASDDNEINEVDSKPSEAAVVACAADDSDSALVASEKCGQFYKCYNGNPVALDCPAGLLYNEALQVCDWPENVKCGERQL